MRTRRQDVFQTPDASLFSSSKPLYFLSEKLLCKCAAHAFAHSQFMLSACTPTFQTLLELPPIFTPTPPKIKKLENVILSHTSRKYVFIAPFYTLLMPPATCEAPCHLQSRLLFSSLRTFCIRRTAFLLVAWAVKKEARNATSCSNFYFSYLDS